MAHEPRMDFRRAAPEAYRALAALTRAAGLDHGLSELVKVRVSQVNGCAYCVDLHIGAALKAGEHQRRLDALVTWRESPFFTDAERAALALAEALTDLPSGPVPEGLYDDARAALDEEGLVGLVVTITGINAWNRAMIAAGDQPPPIE